jgi:hypothetical protein
VRLVARSVIQVPGTSAISESPMPGTFEVVGVGEVGHDEMAHREGKLKFDLRVPPDLQSTGIGKALYDAICAHIAPMQPHELQRNCPTTHSAILNCMLQCCNAVSCMCHSITPLHHHTITPSQHCSITPSHYARYRLITNGKNTALLAVSSVMLSVLFCES